MRLTRPGAAAVMEASEPKREFSVAAASEMRSVRFGLICSMVRRVLYGRGLIEAATVAFDRLGPGGVDSLGGAQPHRTVHHQHGGGKVE